MKQYFLSVVVSIVSMLAIDAVWLSTMAKRFYGKYIGHLMATTPELLPAAIFYVIYTIGLTILVVVPAIEGGYSTIKTLLYGAVFGLVAYATYDLTNQATLREWPTIVTAVDLLWGTFLTAIVTLIATRVVTYFI